MDPRPSDRIIGFLSGSAEEGVYVLQGIADEARRHGCRLVNFSGSQARTSLQIHDKDNVLFQLIAAGEVDGLIVSGSLSHHMAPGEFQSFLDRFQPLPLVTLSVQTPGHPCVVCDNRGGLALLVEHLITVHGYTRLAYLGGPPGQQEAELRLEGFLGTLKAHGLGLQPGWLVHGDYSHASGQAAARRLAETGLEGCQALVCANDVMAMAAIEVLRSRGFQIPRELGVTGFDDHPQAGACEPALTTAGQNFYEQSVLAVQALVDLMAGRPVPPVRRMLPRLTRRASCGCTDDQTEPEVLGDALALMRRHEWRAYRLSLAQRKLFAAGERLVNCHGLAELLGALKEEAQDAGLTQAHVALFESGREGWHQARLRLSWNEYQNFDLPPEGLAFASRSFHPEGLRSLRWTQELLLVQSLVSRDTPLGLALWGVNIDQLNLAQTIGKFLSVALEELLLLGELEQARDQLVQSEKMAALGGLVAGVAHEINTPLGIAVTASSFLAERVGDLRRHFEAGDLRRAALEDFFQRAGESSSLIQTHLQKAHELIQSFKKIAVDQSSEERRPFGALEYCRDVTASLKPKWRHRPLEVSVTGPTDFELDSYPGALAQVLTNLVMNCLMHAFEETEAGQIDLTLTAQGNDRLRLVIADTGRGIPEAHLGRIFDPFFTTRRGQGGSGLGLHIVYNLVTKTLGGTIRCESGLHKGCRFVIELPRRAP